MSLSHRNQSTDSHIANIISEGISKSRYSEVPKTFQKQFLRKRI